MSDYPIGIDYPVGTQEIVNALTDPPVERLLDRVAELEERCARLERLVMSLCYLPEIALYRYPKPLADIDKLKGTP